MHYNQWVPVTLDLSENTLAIFTDQNKTQQHLRLNLAKGFRITERHSKQFSLDTGGSGMHTFRSESELRLQTWVSRLSSLIPPTYDLKHSPTMSQEVLREIAQTGDLLLFSGKSLAAGMFRMVTRSKYDHVAVLVRVSESRLVVLESLRETGVSVCDWDRFVTKKWHNLYSLISYRRLSCDRPEPDFSTTVNDFVR